MAKNIKKDPEFTARIKKVARIMGYSEQYVRYVIKGERKNDTVFTCYMTLLENEEATESSLFAEAQRIVPFS